MKLSFIHRLGKRLSGYLYNYHGLYTTGGLWDVYYYGRYLGSYTDYHSAFKLYSLYVEGENY